MSLSIDFMGKASGKCKKIAAMALAKERALMNFWTTFELSEKGRNID